MRRKDDHSGSTTNLKIKSGGTWNPSTVGNDDNERRLERIRSAAVSALKLLSVAFLVEDDTSAEFFSDYSNFKTMYDTIKKLGLIDEPSMESEESFGSEPQNKWMGLLLCIFITLYAFEDHTGVNCDAVTEMENGGEGKGIILGHYFSKTLRLESLDWKDHKIDLFVPNDANEKMLFIIDDEPLMFTTPPPPLNKEKDTTSSKNLK